MGLTSYSDSSDDRTQVVKKYLKKLSEGEVDPLVDFSWFSHIVSVQIIGS